MCLHMRADERVCLRIGTDGLVYAHAHCALMNVCLRIGTDGLVSAHAHLWTCVYACTLMNMCLRMRTD